MSGRHERNDDSRRVHCGAGLEIRGVCRLERGRCLVVAIRRGTTVALGLEKVGAGERLELGRCRSEGEFVQVTRLPVRGDRRRTVCAGHGRGVGCLELAGTLEVGGEECMGPDIGARCRRLGRPPMQLAPAWRREVVVDGVADDRVPESQSAGGRRREEQVMVGQFGQIVGQRIWVFVEDGREEVDIERSPDDRSGLRHSACTGRSVRQADQDGVLDRGGGRRRSDGPGRRQVRRVEDGQELLDMQRDPVRSGVQGVDHVTRRRRDRCGDEGDHGACLGPGQATQPDLLRESLGQEAHAPLAHRDTWRQFIGPIRREDQERDGGQPPGECLEHLEREVVRPVQVLQRQKERAMTGSLHQQIHHVQDQQAPTARPVGRRIDIRHVEPTRQPRPDVPVRIGPAEGPREVHDDRGTHLGVAGIRATPDRAHPGRRRAALDRADKPRLPHAGFPGHEDQLAAAGDDFGDATIGQLEQVVAPDDDRTHDGTAMVADDGRVHDVLSL